jgi:hypothetical protein
MNHSLLSALLTSPEEMPVKEMLSTKFLGSLNVIHLNCRNPTEQIIPKLSGACYAVRLMFRNSNFTALKWIYFAYFNSIIKYGIMVGVILPLVGGFFTLETKIISIMAGAWPRTSYRSLFKKSEFLAFSFQYVFFVNEPPFCQ